MPPPDERFDAAEGTAEDVYDGLVVELQLFGMVGELPQVVLERNVGEDVGQHLAVHDPEAVLAGALGFIQADVGIPEKALSRVPGFEGERDPDARADRNLVSVDLHTWPNGCCESRCALEGRFRPEDPRRAPRTRRRSAGRRVPGAQAPDEPVGHRSEHLVTHRMTQRVVDRLEFVEIAHHHRHDRVSADTTV